MTLANRGACWRAMRLGPWALAMAGLAFWGTGRADELSEYRLKAAFLYNFAVFTKWPADVGGTLHLCINGRDPFGRDIDDLNGRVVGTRSLAVQRRAAGDSLRGCQIVFVTSSAIGTLPLVLEQVRGRPVLTVADSLDAARQGVALNLAVNNDKVSFEANLQAARGAGLQLSSNLLRLATEVIQ